MEKRTVHSFNGLAIFVFLLYFTNVSSDPIKTTKIIDFMKSDTELCPVPVFLYTDTIISTCANESYPVGTVTTDYTFRNMFLCLIFYDAWYKVCQSRQLQDSFNAHFTDGKAFNSYLQQLAPKEEDKDGSIFCKNVKGVTFSHEKIKSKLSFLHNFDSHAKCLPFCFDMNDHFIPLCEILAWSKNIDTDAKKLATKSQTENITLKKNQSLNEDQSSKGQKPIKNSQITTIKIHEDSKPNDEVEENTSYKDKAKSSSSERKPVQTTETKLNPMNDQEHGDDQTVSRKETNIKPADPKDVHTEPEILQKKPQGVSKESQDANKSLQDMNKGLQDADKILQSIDKPQTTNKESQNLDKELQNGDKELQNIDKELQTEGPPTVNKDLPITNKESDELAANTETNPDELNRSGDEKLIDDQNDQGGLDALVDTDQPQNMHKPSEEKVSSFHTMRTDEESHFFTYFTVLSLISIVAYIGYCNKQKILAIVLEGRRSRNSRGRRRPSTANYRKLDCTLEEAVTSQCNANVTHVIY
ncbi:uncharacterized protein LOC143210779 [Lasioglossum baleicum]|uniref:uncharacterized protein LOC143210779 n=1 Tax=Lasioglossum baleicum TaxID=434251 RepID=UPI003FCD4093